VFDDPREILLDMTVGVDDHAKPFGACVLMKMSIRAM
jgi:hypothetical protein